MSEPASLRVLAKPQRTDSNLAPKWLPSTAAVIVGKDVLELLSTSMYVDAMTIYREYVQNAADAVDEARDNGLLAASAAGTVDVHIDSSARTIRIRDNGVGVARPQFEGRLSSLGSSAKRGTAARGFRGVGRLAGLGYCQELIFRSRVDSESEISEMRWDCRALKTALRSAKNAQPLAALVQEIVSVRRVPASTEPSRFFEVELRGIVRHRNDRLLSPTSVADYLAQVAPLPFSPDFRFGDEIEAALQPHVRLGHLEIRINNGTPLCRPHRNRIEVGDQQFDRTTDLEIRELIGVDGKVGAIAWVAHHGYTGALPAKAQVKGLRFRVGNMQVGDNNLVEELFPEPRFNGWAIGEVHVLDDKVLPNGRRDHFEQSVHFDSLANQLAPVAREIARRCRQSSIGRKWLREFELCQNAALAHAQACARGGISRTARKRHSDAVAKTLKSIAKILASRHIAEGMRSDLSNKAKALEVRVTRLLGSHAEESDPLERFTPQARAAYQNVIAMIYELASNSAAAVSLVDKILSRLSAEPGPPTKLKSRDRRNYSTHRRARRTKQ